LRSFGTRPAHRTQLILPSQRSLTTTAADLIEAQPGFSEDSVAHGAASRPYDVLLAGVCPKFSIQVRPCGRGGHRHLFFKSSPTEVATKPRTRRRNWSCLGSGCPHANHFSHTRKWHLRAILPCSESPKATSRQK